MKTIVCILTKLKAFFVYGPNLKVVLLTGTIFNYPKTIAVSESTILAT